ncbi:hypothetical protein ANO11243_073740 [Dothideomycetidae sp. 11243]|nr:hypothetical protein ANO11243_073740 [fungal sp. No.11243]
MVVSHVGLSVLHIGPASSFYTTALRPLGYKWIGTRNNQIGFGVNEADFFLSPAAIPPTPIHVAFAATSTLAVRDFYAAALRAGGAPAGPPGYRGDEVQIFNAAVADPEGNTVEAVFHCDSPEPEEPTVYSTTQAASQIATEYNRDQGRPYSASHVKSQSSRESPQSQPRSTMKSPSSVHRSPSRHSQSSWKDLKMYDSEDGGPSRKLVGTLIGAAASAAALCAMLNCERDSRRRERAFSDDVTAHGRHRRASEKDLEDLHYRSGTRHARTFSDVDVRDFQIRTHTTDHSLDTSSRTPSKRSTSRRDSLISAGSRKASKTGQSSRSSYRSAYADPPRETEHIERIVIRYRQRTNSEPPRDISPRDTRSP